MAEPKVLTTATVAILSDGSVKIMLVDMVATARDESEIEKHLKQLVGAVKFLCKTARETDWTESN